MSMTKTGIIGLVVLIVILIGGYSILTRSGNDFVSNTATSTGTSTELENGSTTATTTATTTNDSTVTTDQGSQTETDTAGNDNGTQVATNENTNVSSGNTVSSETVTATPVATESFPNRVGYQMDDVTFSYPSTWNVSDINDGNDSDVDASVTMGHDFAGGMKAEMTVTVYDNATIVTDANRTHGNNEFNLSDLGTNDIVVGQKYETKLECKGEDLDCAGKTLIIPVSGHMTKNGWQGKVVKVSYGVFQMSNYHGPDSGVSAQALYNVSQSVFQGVVNTMSIGGIGSGGGS